MAPKVYIARPEDGEHFISARSYDGTEFSDTALEDFDVLNYWPPEVSVTDHPSKASGVAIIAGTAEHAEWVEVKIDSGAWKKASGTEHWSYTIDSKGLDNGQHTVYVRAYSDGQYSEVSSFSMEVDNQEELISQDLLCIAGFAILVVLIFAVTRRRR